MGWRFSDSKYPGCCSAICAAEPDVLLNVAPNGCGSVFWLLVYRETGEPAAFYPFVSCFAANVGIIALVRHKFGMPELGRFHAIAVNVAKGMIVVVPSVLVMDGLSLRAWVDIVICLIAVFMATALFYQFQPELSTFPVDGPWWVRQAVIVAGASALALLPSLPFFVTVT